MSLPTVGWGILGTGNIARQFALDLVDAQAGPIVAVASRDPAKARRFIQANLPVSYPAAAGDYDRLLADDRVQAVYLALPNTLHHHWTIKALQAGKHVLCEKPLAVDLDEAKEMFAVSQRCERLLMEAWMYRCHPLTHAWMQQIRQGAIGQVRLVKASFCYLTRNIQNNIRFKPDLAGGVLYDLGVYPVSLTQMIAGDQEPVDVHVIAHRHESGVDDGLTGTLGFADGMMACFSCGMNLQADNTLEVCGSDGYLSVPVPWKPPVKNATFSLKYSAVPRMDLASFSPTGTAVQTPQAFSVDSPCGLYGLEARALAAAIVDHTPLPVTTPQSLSVMRTLMRLKACLDG